jgi:hypothetical protein
MIKNERKNIFDVNADIIIHQCNCFHKDSYGLTQKIFKDFPEAKIADENTVKSRSKLGSYSFSQKNNKVIINLYAIDKKNDLGISTNYNSVEVALKNLNKEMPNFAKICNKKTEDLIIALPFKMGCGFGGGNWDIVYSIIKSIFDYEAYTILICDIENQDSDDDKILFT